MSVAEGYNPAHRGHRRMDTANNSSSLLSPHQRSPVLDSNPFLTRSKSDMDMPTLPRTRSISHASYTITSSRSETFPRVKEEKQGGMKSLLSKSSKLLHKRRTSNRLKSLDWQTNEASRSQIGGLDSLSRPFISEPYNFRHLTHGGPAQARALQSTDHNQLVTEFSVIRASQAPKPELKGIKADDIVPQNIHVHSSPVSRSPSPPSCYSNALRSTKSVDCFTRLTSNSFSSPYPPLSPPRTSSKQFQEALALSVQENNDAGASSPTYSTNQDFFAATQEIAQAVTTPDNSAQIFMTHQRTTSNLALADVPEEEEELIIKSAPQSRIRDLRHAKSFPARIVSYEDNNYPELISALVLGEDSKRNTEGLSSELSQSDWEDDIDYCYEHAMEAASVAWGADTIYNSEVLTQSPKTTSPYFQSSFSTVNSGSAASSSISVPGIITPDTALNRDSFATSHSLLFPVPFSPALDVELVNTKTKQSTYTPTIITEYSPRNSSLTSDWSSQDSIPTRTTSIATTSQSSKHRYSSSGDSIPDMLPYGMTQRSKSTASSFHRSKSSENVISKPLTMVPPQLPVASRLRANSEAAGKFLDLSLIGAPSTGASYRSRAGSVASVRPRASYNLFPTTSMVTPPR